MKRMVLLVFLLPGMTVCAWAEQISQAEWFMGSDPGAGNGNAITIGSPAAQIGLNFTVGTASLAPGFYRVFVRCRTDTTLRWGVPCAALLVIAPGAATVRLCTQFEWAIDNGTFTTVDVADSATITLNQIVATNSITQGLHRFNLRVRDETGRISQVASSLFIVTSPFGSAQPRTITAAEYYINSDPGPGNGVAIPLPDDSAYDQSQENVTSIVTGLPIGLHLVGIRVRDNLGRWSVAVTDTILVGPLLVIHGSGSNIILDWQSGSGVSRFNIYRANTVSGPYALIDSTAAQTYTDSGILDVQARQYYRVTFKANELSTFRLPRVNREQTIPKAE